MRMHEQAGAAGSELSRLLARYSGATYRYLLGAVRDPDVADELAQEFALRFVRGDFHRANPERGRFRDYLKTALINLVNDHHRQQQDRPCGLGVEPAAPSAAESPGFRRRFPRHLAYGIAGQNLEGSRGKQRRLSRRFVLSHREPQLRSRHRSPSISARASGKPVNAPSARKMLERAHAKFADLLVDEVANSLESGSDVELERELADLDLLRYCRSALHRRNR